MPSSKKYDEEFSDKSEKSFESTSDYNYSDFEYTPLKKNEIDWYDFNQEHIINIWELIRSYIDENGLNLLENANIISFTNFCAQKSYRKEFDNRIASKRCSSIDYKTFR